MPTGSQRLSEQKADRFALNSAIEPDNCLRESKTKLAPAEQSEETMQIRGCSSMYTFLLGIHLINLAISLIIRSAGNPKGQHSKQGSIVTSALF